MQKKSSNSKRTPKATPKESQETAKQNLPADNENLTHKENTEKLSL